MPNSTTRSKSISKPKFLPSRDFHKELSARVDDYFERADLGRRDQPKMYFKIIFILSWLFASYIALVFGSFGPIVSVLLAINLGFAIAGMGFNVMHDGGHRSVSKNARINRVMALSADLVGASSFLWYHKHNVYHHTYANITGHDNDIELEGLGRFCPHQPYKSFFRFQHIYMPILYGFLPFLWFFISDIAEFIGHRTGKHPIPAPKTHDKIVFWGGKTLFVTLALVIPMSLHAMWPVLALFSLALYVEGLLLAIVFQMAHCVEDTDFPVPNVETGRIEQEWALHQLATTMDFARHNRMLTWYIGGLNFQVVHHLFPNISHVHYPEIAKILESTCNDMGVTYHVKGTFREAFASHIRLLKRLGVETPSRSVLEGAAE